MSHSSSTFAEQFCQRANDLAQLGVDALGPLYDLTAQRLVRYASMVTYQQQDAEDAVHSALTKLARRPALLARLEAPWPYLLRMVRNEALLIGRKGARAKCAGDLANVTTRPRIDDLELQETQHGVWVALRRLPNAQSEVIALKIWEQMTFVQIAHILGISANTAASRYRYGMERLKLLLQPVMERDHA